MCKNKIVFSLTNPNGIVLKEVSKIEDSLDHFLFKKTYAGMFCYSKGTWWFDGFTVNRLFLNCIYYEGIFERALIGNLISI